ncbi:outer membrane autotransporter protein [Luteibacter rhizovicinus]|uniref:Outer membrane autotransporter protein n=1 Tax=Luteibacter rhizovicinus TaxID=242606 RepID=A0A4R3YY37_9GAMM|nr:autotransporter outer membrane beta-barrel domain-containing protein [Luteibacter rhizovicinus]TCV96394.1 outer membrane autotransporter protein [Luteibacter rhizovicinus]
MNTIYRIVWNAATGKWVVASELAKSRTRMNRRRLTPLAVSFLLAGVAMAQVHADTISFPSGSTVDIGSDTRVIDGLTVSNGATGTIIGTGGTLIYNGGDFRIGGTASNTVQNLDMSGLTNFVFDSPTAVFSASGRATGGAANTTGVSNTTFNLASGTNVITASSFGVADTSRTVQGPATNQGTVRLGQTNTINADQITIGTNQTNGTLNFQDGISGGTVKIRGTDGISAVSNWNIATGSNSNYSGAVGLADFTGGILDAKVDALTIATSVFGTNPATGTFSLGQGVLDANTILLGQRTSTSGAGNTTARLNIGGGGTVLANTVTVGVRTGTTGTVSSTINLNGGALRAGSVVAGAGTATRVINFNNGVLGNYANGQDMTVNVPIVLAAAGTHTFQVDGANALMTVSGVTSGAGGTLNKAGTGTLMLTANNTYTGGTTVNEGLIRFQTGANLGTGGITLDGGGLQWATGNTLDISTRLNALGSNGAVLDTNGNNVTLAGALTGANGQLIKQGAGTLTLTGNNTYDGVTQINAGDVVVGNGGTTGSIAGDVVNNTQLTINRSDAATLAGAISGVGTLVQAGTGTTILTGNNTYTGNTLVNAGGLQLGNGGTSGSVAGNVSLTAGTKLAVDRSDISLLPGIVSGAGSFEQVGTGTTVLASNQTYTGGTTIAAGTLQLGNGGSTGNIVGDVVNNGTLAFNFSGGTIFRGQVSGTGSLQQMGGTTVLTADNTNTGGTVIDGGMLQLGSGGTTGSIVGDIVNNGSLAIGRSDNVTLAGTVSGRGMLAQIGTGTTVLTADNTYTGGTLISGGILQLGDGGTTGGIVGDAINNGILTIDRADTVTQSGQMSGTGSLWQNGGGTTVLTGDNTYTGTTQVNAGHLHLGDGGTSGSIVGDVVLASGTTLRTDRADASLLPGTVSGAGALEQIGAGTTVLAGNNTYTGGTTIDAGTLQLGNGGSTGSVLGDVANSGTLAFNRADDVTFSNAVSGTGRLTQLGLGTLNLSGDQTYTGATQVQRGTLSIGGSIQSDTSVAAGATLSGFGVIHGNVYNEGTLWPGNAIAGDTTYGTLTIQGDYVGNNGRLALNSFLGTDDSPSSKLVIDGGNASGTTNVVLHNTSTTIGQTFNDGILVIAATNGGTTDTNAFALQGQTRSGASSYRLFRGDLAGTNPDNWYLRNQFVVPDPVDPVKPVDPIGPDPVTPVDPGAPDPTTPPGPPDLVLDPNPVQPPLPPGSYPIIGPEIATYGVIQPIARELGMLTLGTMQQRTGDSALMQPAPARDDSRPAVWTRVFASNIDNTYRAFAAPRAKGNLSGLQVGADLWQSTSSDGSGYRFGGYLAHSNADVRVRGLVTNDAATNYEMQRTGSVNLQANSAGAYWTHYGRSGWYLDGVVQASTYRGTASTDSTRLSPSGTGFMGSLEFGYPFAMPQLGSSFVLEPQVQAVWQQVRFGEEKDAAGSVALGTTQGTSGRVGLRGKWQVDTSSGARWEPYVAVNYWHDRGARATTVYSGTDSAPLLSTASRVEVSGGVTARLTTNLGIYASASYQVGVGATKNAQRDSFTANAGIRFTW